MSNELDQRDKIGICFLLVIVLGGAIGAYALIYNNSLIIVPMETHELTVTQMEFTTSSDSDVIIIYFVNIGTGPVKVEAVKINDEKITKDSIHGLTSESGDSGTIIIEYDWITGNSYTANLFISDGKLVGGYTDTA